LTKFIDKFYIDKGIKTYNIKEVNYETTFYNVSNNANLTP